MEDHHLVPLISGTTIHTEMNLLPQSCLLAQRFPLAASWLLLTEPPTEASDQQTEGPRFPMRGAARSTSRSKAAVHSKSFHLATNKDQAHGI